MMNVAAVADVTVFIVDDVIVVAADDDIDADEDL